MGVSFRVEVRGMAAALRRLEALSGENLEERAREGLIEACRGIAEDAKERAPYDKGDLRRAIQHEGLEGLAARAYAPPINGVPYPFFQHEGTGIYGPKGVPIRPKKPGGWLVFKVKGAILPGKGRRAPSSLVFAKEVRGVPPTPFMRDAGMAAVMSGDAAAAVRRAVLARDEAPGGEDA